MKKLFFSFLLLMVMLPLGSSAITLDEAIQYFTIETNRYGKSFEASMSRHDVSVEFSSGYDPMKREFIMSMIFDKKFFDNLNGKAMKKAKQTTLQEWSHNYKTQPQFKEMVDKAKEINGIFRVVYSCSKGGDKLKSKDYKITPDEIINYKPKK